jgi:hypothetical protein
VFTTTLSSTTAQASDLITANESGAQETTTVAFTAGTTASSTKSSVTVNPGTVTADGVATTTVTVTVEDANGNLIPNAAVTLSSSGGSGDHFAATSGFTNSAGVFTTTLSSTTAQASDLITANESGAQETTTVVFTAPTAPTVAISLSNTNLTTSNNTAIVTFTFSEAPTAFSLSDTTATGGTLSNLQQTSPTIWTALFTANGNTQTTTASVRVTSGSYQDAAGILGTAGSSGNFSVDTIPNSWANPSGGSWTDPANWSSGTVPSSTANVQISPYGSTPYTVTILPSASVVVNSLTLSDPNATVLDEGTLSILLSLVMSAGVLQVSNGGTLSVGSAAGLTVNIAGTGGNLTLGSSFTGTVDAVSTADGAVAIAGGGNVTTVAGDAVDLTASGGTQSNPANLSVGPTGAITGARNGISVVQNGVGDITVTASGPVIGQSGYGIYAEENASASGNILINGSGSVTGTGTTFDGIFAEILNPANNGNITVSLTGNISGGYDGINVLTDGNGNVNVSTGANSTVTGLSLYGIRAGSSGTGNVTVTTGTGSTISSASAGISAYNQATSIPQTGGVTTSSIAVTANGTINSGTALTLLGNRPAGILAGYLGGSTATVNPAVFGNVTVDNFANITAAGGDGIRAYNYGNGNVTVNDHPSTTINAKDEFGIEAFSYGTGNLSVTTTTSDSVTSGSAGLVAQSNATSIPQVGGITTNSISITAVGTINSGSAPTATSNVPAGIIAGYAGATSGNGTPNAAVFGNVVVNNSANINAAAGDGIRAFNYGNGNITVNDLAGTTITAPGRYGILASDFGAGDISITTSAGDGINSGTTGIQANGNGGGSVSVTNNGMITVANGVGISAGTGNGAAGSVSGVVSVTNSGTVVALGSTNNPVIQINNESTQGATFTNSGTITSQLFSASSQNQALGVINGSVTVNNSGTITGNVSLATATFNNNSGGIWNVAGSNFFGNGANLITNAGIINVADVTIFAESSGASGSLAFENANAVNLLADSYAYIGGPVTGLNGTSGTFSIGDFSTLEFASSVAAGQTVSFVDGNASLAIDNSAFGGTLANLQIGDTIQVPGVSIQSVAINTQVVNGVTEQFLQITQTNNQVLFLDNLINGVYQGVQLTNFPGSGVQFSILSSDAIQLVPSTATLVSGASAPTTEPASSSPQFYILSNSTISGSTTGPGFRVASTDSTSGDFVTVEITQTSSISGLQGTANGVNLTTTGANIALINAGSITSPGGLGIVTNSGAGSTIIVDYGNVSGATNGISANTSGGGQILIGVNAGATVTGTGTSTSPGFAVAAFSLGGNVIVNTSPGDVFNSGSTGINAQDQAASIAQASNSSISISTYGTINSGATPPSAGNEPGGIKTGYNGGSNAPTTAVFGNVTVNNNANITAAGGLGIFAFNNGVGNIDITDGGGTTITATAAGPTSPGSAQYGIGAFGYEAGNTTVSTAKGSTINSGSAGIDAVNQATVISQAQTSSVTVVALGSINSGVNTSNSNLPPAGIVTGFSQSTLAFDPNVNGNVFVDFGGTINAAAGDGIRAFNYGVGNVTVNVQGGGSSITATHSATAPSDNAPYGVGAFNFGPGNISVTTASGDVINSGSAGINAANEATAISSSLNSSIVVTAAGTINSGTTLTNFNNPPAGILAGYIGATSDPALATPANSANSSVFGETVVNNSANINAAAGDGIRAFNFGIGDVTVNDFAGTITALGAAVNPPNGYGDGLVAANYGTGGARVTTAAGTIINAGSSGIVAVNKSTTVDTTNNPYVVPSTTQVSVLAYGTVQSGTIPTPTVASDPAAGILAGFNPNDTNTVNNNIHGNVAVDNFASILNTEIFNVALSSSVVAGDTIELLLGGSALAHPVTHVVTSADVSTGAVNLSVVPSDLGANGASSLSGEFLDPTQTVIGSATPTLVGSAQTDGIRGVNYGTGNISIVNEAGASVTAIRYGLAALGFDGGNVTVTNKGSVTAGIAIDAITTGTGTASIDNSGHLGGNADAYNASFTNEAAGSWSFNGVSAFTGASNLVNFGVIQSNGSSEISGLSSIANSGTIEVQSGNLKLDAGVSGTGTLKIDAGATLEVISTVSSGQTVAFNSTTGMLKLDQAQNFNGVISGLSTTDGSLAHSDQIDLVDINFNSLSFNKLFNSTTDTLTVTDGTNTAVIHFSGTVGALNFIADGNPIGGVNGTSGTIVYDPPSTSQSVDPGQGVIPVTMHDPGLTSSTSGESATNQTWGGLDTSDNFVFNFERFDHHTMTDFHPHFDVHEFDESIANTQAILNALHDDGHTVTAVNDHDSIVMSSALKAHQHTADFHVI